jgi:hypothetical protein
VEYEGVVQVKAVHEVDVEEEEVVVEVEEEEGET